MRATRAIVGAFGAGFTLAIASSVVLLVVSSVIAFNGWPDDLSGPSESDVASLMEASGPIGAPPKSEPVAFDLPSAPASSGSGRTRGSATADRDTTTSGTGTSGSQTTSAGQGTSAEATEQADGADPAPRRSTPIQPVTDAVRDTTSAVGNAVVPVTPSVGGALESVGAAGADTVDQVTQTADGPVQQLLP